MSIERTSKKAPGRPHPPSATGRWHDEGANRCDAPSWPPIIRIVWAGGVASLAAVAVRFAAGVQGGPPSGWVGAVVEAIVPFASAAGFGGVLVALSGMLATVVLAITVLLGVLLVGRLPGAAARRRAIIADGSIWTWLVLTLGSTLLVSPPIGMITLAAAAVAAWRLRAGGGLRASGGQRAGAGN